MIAAYSGVFSALLLLTLIVVISNLFRGTPRLPSPQSKVDLTRCAVKLFTEADFPMALINRKLEICFANNSFTSLYLASGAIKSFEQLLKLETFAQKLELKELVTTFQQTGDFPDRPVFMGLKLPSDAHEKEFNQNFYIVVRRLIFDECPAEPLMAMSLIDSSYTSAITLELVDRIAQKESNLKKMEEIDRLKSEFLATLSHELKTPLVSIKGYLDLMATEKFGPLTEKQEKALRVSLKNTSHLNSLISSILNFARMEAGKLRFDLVNQKLQPLVNDIIDSLRPMADNRNITFVTSLPEDIPVVILDPELIHRVISNLLENAIKFSPAGSQIFISASRFSDNLIRLAFKDHGCGIPADKLDKIKAPFYQADRSDTRPTGGLGLGLAIAEKILVGHGTTLAIESEEGQGTTCSFMLKIASNR